MPVALLSVFEKQGIVEFARGLVSLGWEILASGGTARHLAQAGVPVKDVADLVGGGAILGHRVVTLSREVHAGLLARSLDAEEMQRLNLPYINLVCVDLYPLEQAIAKPDATLDSVIEMTDIGGPTMLRSGAKGDDRIVICDPADREYVLNALKAGPLNGTLINVLAAKAERVVANYCLASARFRSGGTHDGVIGTLLHDCCYGENRWQSPAALFSTGTDDPLALDKFELIQGSAPSFINWRDLDRLLQTITHIAAAYDLNRGSTPQIAVGCKHGNPCGAAISDTPEDTTMRMVLGDPLALFGGVVMTNFTVTATAAEIMLSGGGRRVLDGIAAPSFEPATLSVLKRKNDRCRLYQNPALANLNRQSLNTSPMRVPVRGGFLRQPNYTFVLDLNDPDIQQTHLMPDHVVSDLLLAWAVGSTSNSNTVALVKNNILIGNGVGQQDRVGGCDLAIRRAQRSGHNISEAVAYSDSFFPFTDGPELLAKAGVTTILTTSGSANDQKVRDCCASHNIALLLLPDAEARGFFGH